VTYLPLQVPAGHSWNYISPNLDGFFLQKIKGISRNQTKKAMTFWGVPIFLVGKLGLDRTNLTVRKIPKNPHWAAGYNVLVARLRRSIPIDVGL